MNKKNLNDLINWMKDNIEKIEKSVAPNHGKIAVIEKLIETMDKIILIENLEQQETCHSNVCEHLFIRSLLTKFLINEEEKIFKLNKWIEIKDTHYAFKIIDLNEVNT